MMEHKKLEGKKILMVIGSKNFRDEEYFVPFEIFQRQGAKVVTASSVVGEIVGIEGGEARSTLLVRDINSKDFDAIVFIGGDGAREYFDDNELHKLIMEFYTRKKVIAAICIAPIILAKSGVLRFKNATVWTSLANKSGLDELKSAEAIFCDQGVVTDKKIITANGPAMADQFAKAIMEILSRHDEEEGRK